MDDEDEIDITDIGRYGADPKRVKQLNKKRMKIEVIESESSSEESSSSSAESSDDEDDRSGAEVSAEIQLEDKDRVRRDLEQRIRQAAQEKTQITVDDGDEAEAELYNLKRVLDRAGEKLNKASESAVVDLDDDDDDEEDDIEDSAPRIRYVDDEDESELEDAPQENANLEEEEEEESEEEEDEEELFTLTFKFKGSKFTVRVNPNQPMSEAFNTFLDRANVSHADRARKIIYRFDGSALKASQTPTDQDLESEDQIDVDMK